LSLNSEKLNEMKIILQLSDNELVDKLFGINRKGGDVIKDTQLMINIIKNPGLSINYQN